MTKKILILILSCKHPIYEKIKYDGIEQTWNSYEESNTQTYYYYGDSSSCYHDDNNIYVTSKDSFYHILDKTIEVFNYCLSNFDFDYIYRTNTSSYINKQKLSQWIQNKPLSRFYSGLVGQCRGIKYASGSGYFLSKDLVEYLLEHLNDIDRRIVFGGQEDDLAIGTVFQHINIIPAPRQDIECNINNKPDINNYFHFRCKCQNNRLIDIQQMHKIHKLIKNNK